MNRDRVILDYAPASATTRRRIVNALAGAVPYAGWFVWHRPIRALEVVVAAWLVIAVAWVWHAMLYRRGLFAFPEPILVNSVVGAVLIVGFVAAARILVRRRWRALRWCVLISLASSLATGMLQWERCPHATYLQVLSIRRCMRKPSRSTPLVDAIN
jgi:hypothetical protein